jgi:hypothetical protein
MPSLLSLAGRLARAEARLAPTGGRIAGSVGRNGGRTAAGPAPPARSDRSSPGRPGADLRFSNPALGFRLGDCHSDDPWQSGRIESTRLDGHAPRRGGACGPDRPGSGAIASAPGTGIEAVRPGPPAGSSRPPGGIVRAGAMADLRKTCHELPRAATGCHEARCPKDPASPPVRRPRPMLRGRQAGKPDRREDLSRPGHFRQDRFRLIDPENPSLRDDRRDP